MRAISVNEMEQVGGGWGLCNWGCSTGTTTTTSSFSTWLGGALAQTHQAVETFISSSGLRTPIVTAFDYAVVHPLLWNPLSSLLNYDVANVNHG